MKLIIHIDGGARGNPGPAGAGVSICDASGDELFEAGYFLGRMTNNQAEYNALLRSLDIAEKLGGDDLLIHSDSELMVKQINGEYRVRDTGLKPLFENAFDRLRTFRKYNLRHVRREQNRRADELANLAMDAGEDVVEIADMPVSEAAAEGAPEAPAVPVEVRCIAAPRKGQCDAACRKGETFVFADKTPAGLCMHAACAVLPVVLDVRTGGRARTVTCPNPDCEACFSVGPA